MKKGMQIVIKILRAVLYVLSAGHACSCKGKNTEYKGENADK